MYSMDPKGETEGGPLQAQRLSTEQWSEKSKNCKERPWFQNERKHHYFTDYLGATLPGSRTVLNDGIQEE